MQSLSGDGGVRVSTPVARYLDQGKPLSYFPRFSSSSSFVALMVTVSLCRLSLLDSNNEEPDSRRAGYDCDRRGTR